MTKVPISDIASDMAMVSGNSEPTPESGDLPHFQRPYDWDSIDEAVRTTGGVIVEGFLSPGELNPLNDQIDSYLETHTADATAATGNEHYDLFLGHKTLRLHGLIEKVPKSADLIGRAELVEWAERLTRPVADSVLLNAGELIQIQPGEPAQFLHRDSDSWPLPVGPDPIIVNALIALDACTLENGATYVAPESWKWDMMHQPKTHEFTRAVMNAGDAVLFRADLVHGGGENESDGRRRALSISYCAGWLRPVENSFLNLSRETVSKLPARLQGVLGYVSHDGSKHKGGIVGLYENGDPRRALRPD